MNTSHYPDIELCKKLTDTDFPETQECIYDENKLKEIKLSPFHINAQSIANEYKYKCPSIAELLDKLPDHIILPEDK